MDFLETLQQRPMVCDGAMGTMLQARGLPADACPEVWCLEHPDVLSQVHRDYLDAGADIVLSCTFGANRYKLGKYGIEMPAGELSQKLAQIALATTAEGQFVLGDIGPTGEFMQPLGLATESDIQQAFAEQAEGFVAAGVDGIIVETMMDLAEAQVAVRAAKQTGLPVVASMSFNPDANGFRTMMGVSPTQAAEGLVEAGADVIGANCGSVLMDQMTGVVEEMAQAGASWMLIEANAGIPEMVDGQTVFKQTPEQMSASIGAVIEVGARIIGGCCGTTPDHIRAIAKAMQ